jgi:L-alanine-DL-glutamate epimerase-like enolase superfamily enzyme
LTTVNFVGDLGGKMKIIAVHLSVFELAAVTRKFRLTDQDHPSRLRWSQAFEPRGREEVHVLHVLTDEGVEGICTVGDARYTQMRTEDLEQLRLLAIGEDPLARERLHRKIAGATRQVFAPPGWSGAFDNCLWDIAGKVAGQPVWRLLGAARDQAPAYYNYFGGSLEQVLDDAGNAAADGWTALKDHYAGDGPANISWFEATRARFPDAVLMHDAALCAYGYDEAVRVGEALQAQGYLWFEEPLPDRSLAELRRLCARLDIPVAACETFMGDHALCAEWLRACAADILRGNARHGTTPLQHLAGLADGFGTTVELNGPGGLFGLLHAHLCCGLAPTTYYEFFPGGLRDQLGKEIGLTNPPLPQAGWIRPPETPGWGADWDHAYFEKVRAALL